MSVCAFASAIIGVKIDESKLYKKVTKKAFPHNYDESFQFDPKSGKPLWKTEKTPIKEFDEEEETLSGLKVVFSTDHFHCFVSAFGTGTSYDENGYSKIELENSDGFIDKLKKELKKALEPLGLWDEKSFGLYSVIYISY
jgi:hypothetical protein